jgi:chemotaxis protein methyltransferase CheR
MDRACITFLQWALPRMRMRWPGFRKVRGQVCKRISRRIADLGLSDPAAYRTYLESNEDEWRTLDSLCRITISRFYRDRGVFDNLSDIVLPRLAKRARADVWCWSAGCASGEEAYTVRILWELRVAPFAQGKKLHMIGTDSDPVVLERARAAAYPASALEDLPPDLAEKAFERMGKTFALRPRFKEDIHFEGMDIRESMPEGPFDIILCRNLVFTYFEEALQREILRELSGRIEKGGVLVIGTHESLPEGDYGLEPGLPAMYERPE